MPELESEGVRLHYEVSGDPHGPVLLLANSLGSNLHMWDKVLPAFESKYRVLRFDMRGHGQSGLAHGAFSIEDLGRDALRLLDAAEADRASICGLSMGGLVALWLGIHAPSRVDRLILANTAARIGSPDMWTQRMDAVQNAGMSVLATATVERWLTAAYRAQHAGEAELIRGMIAATNADGYAGCCAVLRDADLREDVGTVRASSLVITGAHDPATPPADGRALHAAIRDSRYVELNAAHLSAWECATEFAEAVGGHLAGLEATSG